MGFQLKTQEPFLTYHVIKICFEGDWCPWPLPLLNMEQGRMSGLGMVSNGQTCTSCHTKCCLMWLSKQSSKTPIMPMCMLKCGATCSPAYALWVMVALCSLGLESSFNLILLDIWETLSTDWSHEIGTTEVVTSTPVSWLWVEDAYAR